MNSKNKGYCLAVRPFTVSRILCLKKNKNANDEGTPRKTPRGMHSAPNPGVLVIHGSYRRFPLNCPGIGSTQGSSQHPETVSLSATEHTLFSFCSLTGPGQKYLCSQFSPVICDLLYRFRVIGCVNPGTDRNYRCTPVLSFLRQYTLML